MGEVNSDEVGALKATIRDFIAKQAEVKYEPVIKSIAKFEQDLASPELVAGAREDKEKELEKAESKLTELRGKYEVETWLLDAAKRAGQIQLVSHTPKQMNSNAKGASGVLCGFDSKTLQPSLVSSYSLSGKNIVGDVVGNAAALDVNKFLQVDCNGKSLLSRLLVDDESFSKALSVKPEIALQICDGFKAFVSSGEPAAHSLTKQLYFPVKDNYNLLLPLYPSVLVHSIHKRMTTDFFSDETKEARKARKAKSFHGSELHEYPNLAIQSFGGSNPQNISQLNSERHGKSYLLPSLPPSWKSPEIRIPIHVETVFSRPLFARRNTKYWVKALGSYQNKCTHDNVNTRHGRDKILAAIVDEVLFFAEEMRSLQEGWSDAAECKLPDHEKKWLDPQNVNYQSTEDEMWMAKVCTGFARALNYSLKKYQKVAVDDSTHMLWKKGLEKEMKLYRWEHTNG